MTEQKPPSDKLWHYRFSAPDETEIESGDFETDAMAQSRARDLSTSNNVPVVIHRQSRFVDSWEYVTEVDERSATL
jgi:hypothetical protein